MNYIEVGETAVSLARRMAPGLTESAVAALSKEGTSLLERSGFLARLDSNHTVARWLTDAAKEAMPAIQRAAGSATHAGGDLLVVGKPFKSTLGSEVVPHANTFTIYEPHQNISIHPDGQFRIDYPTPSAQRIRSDHFLPDGRWTGNTYSSSAADGYGFMPAPEGVSATVASQFGSRQFMLISAWDASRGNFSINPVIDKFIREGKPVTGLQNLSNVMGRTVSTPFADGKLIGFDRISGEALVTQDGFHSTGLSFDLSNASKRMNQTYPVKLTFADDAQITAQRSPTGKFLPFKVETSDPAFQPNATIFAFSPLEVKLGGRPLSEILGVENSTGLRAMGGYSTVDGARIPIIAPDISYAPRLAPKVAPEVAPRAFMDPLGRGASRPRRVEESVAAKTRVEVEPKKQPFPDPHQIVLEMERMRLHAEATSRSAEAARAAESEVSRVLRQRSTYDPTARPQSSPIDRGYLSPFSRPF
jgi:hypothetical protein